MKERKSKSKNKNKNKVALINEDHQIHTTPQQAKRSAARFASSRPSPVPAPPPRPASGCGWRAAESRRVRDSDTAWPPRARWCTSQAVRGAWHVACGVPCVCAWAWRLFRIPCGVYARVVSCPQPCDPALGAAGYTFDPDTAAFVYTSDVYYIDIQVRLGFDSATLL
jgi:hypothetical protein